MEATAEAEELFSIPPFRSHMAFHISGDPQGGTQKTVGIPEDETGGFDTNANITAENPLVGSLSFEVCCLLLG